MTITSEIYKKESQENNMLYYHLVRILSSIVIVMGAVVLFGWVLDIPVLKSLSADWVTMKFSTAFSFLMSGLIILLINEFKNNHTELTKIFLPVPMIIVLFFMSTLFVSNITGIPSGVIDLFVEESEAIKSVAPGVPSFGTIISFLIIVIVSFVWILNTTKYQKYFTIFGCVVLALSIIALSGYALNNSLLYYEIENWSTAMALHTAITFALLGTSMILLPKSKHKKSKRSKREISIKIIPKITLFVLIPSFITIIAIAVVSINLSENYLEKEQFEHLNTVGDFKIQSINFIFSSIRSDIIASQEYYNIKTNLPILDTLQNEKDSIDYIDSKEMLDKQLKGFVDSKNEINNILLLNQDGKIIYSLNDDKLLGLKLNDPENQSFLQGKHEPFLGNIFQDPDDPKKSKMYSSAPIYDKQENFLGVFVYDINMNTIYKIIEDRGGLGETGEVLLGRKIGDSVVFINQLRHEPDSSFNLKIPFGSDYAIPIQEAVTGLRGVGLSKDYRQEPVYAVWRYIPSLDLGIVSKIDSQEVLMPVYQLKQDTIVVSTVLLIGVGILSISTVRTITYSIFKLKNMAQKIIAGDLSAQITISDTDEIGDLSESFNVMSKTLKDNKTNLDLQLEKITAAEKKFRDLYKTSPDLYVTINVDDKLVDCNPAFQTHFGYTLNEIKGKSIHSFISKQYKQKSFDAFEKLKVDNIIKNIELDTEDKSERHTQMLISAFSLHDAKGKITSYHVILRDITEIHEARKKISEQLKKLKLIDKQKEQFSAMITHELKTPLSTTIGYSDMLKSLKMGELNEEQKFAVDEIFSASLALEQLIENVLTLQKAELRKLRFNIEKISVKELLQQAYNRLLPLMSEKQIEFLISAEDLTINIDKERIMEVFTNLVQNSVDFVPTSEGRIEITSKSDNSDVLFSVIDNGSGIPKDKLGNLFTKYYQVDTSMTRKHGGSGLGLAICKAIVKGSGGKIWIESEEGKGTNVYFTIPKYRHNLL